MRNGLIFTAEITITPHTPLQDARLYLNNGWFQAMIMNELEPTPASQEAQGNRQILDFGKLPASTAFHVWISWQVNPTNVGMHSQDVALYDGGTQLMVVHPTITVFP